MAKILNKDPITYDRERDGFIRDLRHFHETRGTPFRKIPKINGHEIDLYLLYVLVTAHGGWVKVNSRNEWESLVDQFNLPTQCVNSGVGLKQIYLRYLDRYEKVHFLGEDGERGSDDDEESRHKRWSARALHSVPLTYNHHQHNIAEGLRAYNGLSSNLFKPTDYDRLTLSLISPLPNEQDFAINVCMLLSNEGKHTLRLDKCPRLLDLLLAHAGVFNHVSLRQLFHEIYGKIRNHSMHQFWYDTLVDDVSDLTDERKFPTDGRRPRSRPRSVRATPSTSKAASRAPSLEGSVEGSLDGSLEAGGDAMDVDSPGQPLEEAFEEGEDGLLGETRPRLKIEASDYELFCVGRSFGTQDYLGQRVLQIGTVLRNLSFSEENVAVLSKSVTYLRFLLLCVNSRWNTLHQLGLDMLGNIAVDVLVVDPINDRLAGCLVSTITKGISSQDRSVVVSCLEVLNKLSQKDENEEAMLRCIEQQVYEQICRFLTLHDIMLLIQTLECLYSLSSLGERACNCIVRVHGCIDTLVALITVEAQSYGPKACILMRVVETAASGAPAVAPPPGIPTPVISAPVASTPIRSANPAPPPPPPPSPVNKIPLLAAAPSPQIHSVKASGSPAPPPPVTPVSQSQAAQHAAQQAAQENEQFALSWLRAACEPSSGARIAQAELYRQYQAACARIGRRGLVQPLHFPRCVRSVFGGSVGPSLSKTGGNSGDNAPHYEGIKVRAHLLRNSMSAPAPAAPAAPVAASGAGDEAAIPQPSSPILKAQLSAPPKPTKPPAANAAAAAAADKSQVGAHPHLTQALLGGAPAGADGGPPGGAKETPSSLIKSLLASKVNTGGDPSMASMMPVPCAIANTASAAAETNQVTQRQQRLLQQQQMLKNNATPPTTAAAKKPPPKPADPKPKAGRINGMKVAAECPKETHLDNGPTSDLPPPTVIVGNGALPHRQVPPLAPLSSGPHHRPEDEAAAAEKSVIVSCEDAKNFGGSLLNGIPAAEDASRGGKPLASKSLMLADLLEKKVDARKDHPILNGVLGKELRIGDKGLELVENHLDKVLKETACYQPKESVIQYTKHAEPTPGNALKRPASGDGGGGDAKRAHVETNGTTEEAPAAASASAANLYAAFAASALEDEPELELAEEQVLVGSQQQQLIMAAGRQMFVSPPQSQVLITPAGQITLHAAPKGNTVSAQGQARPTMGTQMVQGQVVLTQGQGGQLILSQAPQGQGGMQLGQATYMMAQPQQGMAQHQTVLVTQTQQQQGTGAKTLIIFQNPGGGVSSAMAGTVAGGQKMVMAQSGGQPMVMSQSGSQPLMVSHQAGQPMMVSQQTGQPVVVAQVPRPIAQTPSLSMPAAPTPTLAPALAPGKQAQAPLRNITPSNSCQTRVMSPAPSTKPTIGRPAAGAGPEPGDAAPELPPPPPPASPLAAQLKATAAIDPSAFLCEWRGCMRSFKSANETYMHACENHCPSGSQEIQCLWERCDAMKRKRFSLMTHLYDRHCNADVLKMMAVRRKQLSVSGRSEIPPPAPPPPHPGYAPNAAFHAIKRHALEFVNPKELMRAVKPATVPLARAPPEQDDNEGPVTKSIRLTSSLILRNLVIYSTNGRRFLRSYEPHLASIALSNVESSRTIAQVLYDMNQPTGAR